MIKIKCRTGCLRNYGMSVSKWAFIHEIGVHLHEIYEIGLNFWMNRASEMVLKYWFSFLMASCFSFFGSKPQPCFRNFQTYHWPYLFLPTKLWYSFYVWKYYMFLNIIIGYWIKTRNWNYVFKFSVVKLFYYFIISLSSSTVQTHVKRVESSRIKVEAKELLSLPVRNLYLINKSALNSIEHVSVSFQSQTAPAFTAPALSDSYS